MPSSKAQQAAKQLATLTTHATRDGFVPAGVVLPFAGSTAPSGWLLCYGQAVSRTTYADLYAVLGTTYGSGDGTSTFNLPDSRGRVPAGKDNMGGTAANRLTTGGSSINGATLGATGGAETHTLTTAQMPQHNHGVTDPGHAHGGGQASSQNGLAGTYAPAPVVWTSAPTNTSAAATGISIQNAGSGAAHNNTQPTIILNYIIKT